MKQSEFPGTTASAVANRSPTPANLKYSTSRIFFSDSSPWRFNIANRGVRGRGRDSLGYGNWVGQPSPLSHLQGKTPTRVGLAISLVSNRPIACRFLVSADITGRFLGGNARFALAESKSIGSWRRPSDRIAHRAIVGHQLVGAIQASC